MWAARGSGGALLRTSGVAKPATIRERMIAASVVLWLAPSGNRAGGGLTIGIPSGAPLCPDLFKTYVFTANVSSTSVRFSDPAGHLWALSVTEDLLQGKMAWDGSSGAREALAVGTSRPSGDTPLTRLSGKVALKRVPKEKEAEVQEKARNEIRRRQNEQRTKLGRVASRDGSETAKRPDPGVTDAPTFAGTWAGNATQTDAACDFRGTMTLTFGPGSGHGFIALDLRLQKEKKPGMCTPQRTASGNIVVTTQGDSFRFSIPGTAVSGSGIMGDNQVKGTWIVESAGVKTTGAFLLDVREPSR